MNVLGYSDDMPVERTELGLERVGDKFEYYVYGLVPVNSVHNSYLRVKLLYATSAEEAYRLKLQVDVMISDSKNSSP